MLKLHYGFDYILEQAEPWSKSNPDPHWKKSRIVLEDGDTAYAPGTTKKEFSGTGEIVYAISATGWEVLRRAETIFLQHRGS